MGHLNSRGLVMVAQFVLWLFLNIGVPIFAPMFAFCSMSPAVGANASRAMIRDSIQEGQLFWVAFGMCATGLYEVLTAHCALAWPATFCVVFIVVFCTVGLGSTSVITTAVAGRCLNRALQSELANSPHRSVSAESPAKLVSLGLIESPRLFAQWSILAVVVSAGACVLFHLANVLWLALL